MIVVLAILQETEYHQSECYVEPDIDVLKKLGRNDSYVHQLTDCQHSESLVSKKFSAYENWPCANFSRVNWKKGAVNGIISYYSFFKLIGKEILPTHTSLAFLNSR